MGLIGMGLNALGGLLVRKVTSTDDTGNTKVRRKATPFSKTLLYVIGAALVYQILIWPIITYHFPHYGFPPIDVSAIITIIGGL